MRTTLHILSAVLAALTAASCTLSEIALPDSDIIQEKVRVDVVPSIQGMDDVQTKSSVTSGESAVKDINIFFYHQGLLVASSYVQTPSVASCLLNEGLEYNVYAVANVGKITPVEKEADFIKYKMSVGASGFVSSMNGNGVPMAWQKSGYTVSKTVTQLPVSLVRLVSKIRFKVDLDALAGLKVKSIRLCNAAGAVTPFTMNGHGGSKITSTSEAISGDYASASDLSAINSGGQIYFYALENCQGTLLPGNKDPWKKTPENISVSGLCTYLEVDCEFQSGFALAGTITYRVYIGQDNCTNFDIIRNVDMGITLCLTKNLDNISWKIDPDVDYNGSLGEAWLEQGRHSIDNLYVGETIQWGFMLNDFLLDFLGEELEGYKLVAMEGDEISDAFSFGGIIYSGGDYFCDMKCIAETSEPCALWIADEDGKLITDFYLEDGYIESQLPKVIEGDGSIIRGQSRIQTPQNHICPIINGANDFVYLYLADNEGRNLNVPKADDQYGFDLSLFSILSMNSAPTEALKSYIGTAAGNRVSARYSHVAYSKGTSQNGSYAFKATVGITNPGTSFDINTNLSEALNFQDYHDGGSDVAKLTFNIRNALTCPVIADFGIVKPKFFFGSGDTFPTEQGFNMGGKAYIAVYNPSMIDYHAEVFYVGKRRASMDSHTISGTTQIKYLNSGISPAYLTPRVGRISAQPYFADRSYKDLLYVSTQAVDAKIDGLQCKIYTMDSANGVATLSEIDGNKGYVRGEVGITTMGGANLTYDYLDLNGAYVRSDGTIGSTAVYDYLWGDNTYCYRGTGWYTGNGLEMTVNANKENNVSSLTGYSGANLYNIMRKNPVQFSVAWNSSGKYPELKMTGNTFGAKFKILVGIVYTASCQARNNSNASLNTFTYTMTVPDASSTTSNYNYTLTGESGTVSLPNYVNLEYYFSTMNKNYWHENCTNVINVKGNRYSQLAMPVQADYYITILVENSGLWVPINTIATNPSGSFTTSAYTFYSNTARGTYADTSSMTNPDGTTRGPDSSVDKQASKFSDYTAASGSYKVTFNFLHQQTWNWYNR